jgi:hypothetical protein
MRPHRGSRQGVALFVAVMAALVMGAFATILWTNKGAQRPLEQSFEKRQAEYLAKGAQQHALLKCRLLPTELYDAVSYQIGRNPYFDFGLGLENPDPGGLTDDDADRNPGPLFYTGTVSQMNNVDDPDGDGQILVIRRSGDPEDPGGKFDANMRILLDMFIYDVATLYPLPDPDQGVIVVSSAPHRDLAMEPGGGTWQDPFIGNYKVQTLRILGKDTMLLTTIGSVKRAGQRSIVTLLGGDLKNLSPIRAAKRRGTEDTFGEMDTVFEDAADFEARVGDETVGVDTNDVFDPDSNPDAASGRRTEIATGIYYITRKAVGSGP